MNNRYIFGICLLLTIGTSAQNTQQDSSFYKQPTFTISMEDLEESSEEQDVSGLLQSSKDVFSSIAGYNFSAARFRARGYDSQNYTVMMNGVALNSAESGRAIWAYWGGLNDITRYQESKPGVTTNPYAFGGFGGYSNIEARASVLRPGTRFSSALANRSYSSRWMATHATGLLKNGWALAASASARMSQEGYVAGTFYSAASYFLSIEKKFNSQHSIGLVGFGSPTVQGRQGIVVDEIHQILDDPYYNPYWGYQNGEKRNSRVRNTHKPMLLLSHYWKMSDNSKLNSTLSYSFGKGGNTRINWYNANDPRPDYYRYLPSYYDEPGMEGQYQSVLSAWQNDMNTSQLNWDHLYFANSKNLFTMTDAEGIPGNDVTGNRAKYILEEYFNNHKQWAWNSLYNKQWSEHLQLHAGVELNRYVSQNFKKVKDLLGADFWVDVDQFAERDFEDPSVAQSNLALPNHLVREGDRFGYDYDINIDKYSSFGQLEWKGSSLDAYLALSLSGTQFWRTGKVQNGLFPDNSLGDSEKHSFANPGAKGGVLLKLTGRHMLQANVGYLSRAPLTRNAFISPRTRNEVVPHLKSETLQTADFNYLLRYPNIKLRLTGYYTTLEDMTWSRSFYHDELKTFVNYMMTGVDQLFMGMEMGTEVKLSPSLSATVAYATGDFIYNSRPTATIVQDNSTELLAEEKTVYIQNYRIGGMPQTAASLGMKYNSSKFWFLGVSANYFEDTYLDFNPDRRTDEALEGFVSTDPQTAEILEQTKLDPGYTIDLFLGKSWKIQHGEYVRFNINVSNLLDVQDFETGGFEQLRYDRMDIEKFPARIGYLYGRSYFAMISYIF